MGLAVGVVPAFDLVYSDHTMATSSTPDTPEPTAAELIAARPHLAMHAMDGLVIDDVPLNAIADAVGTPIWVYSASAMRRRYRMLAGALADAGLDAHVHYAVKANDRLAVLRLFAAEGAGADVVSEGELRRAREAGIPADRIVFSGVGKSERELRLALTEDIAQINVESAEELDMLSALAAAMGRTARVALRVNPDVDAGTHAKITTGRAQDKFGIPYADAVAALSPRGGAAGHPPDRTGDAYRQPDPVAGALSRRLGRIAELVRALRADGLPVSVVDCGGGLGIPYRDEPAPLPAALAGAIRGAFHNLDVRIVVEPGRWLVGPAGVLLASVILAKHTQGSRFVVLDAAMNDLVRPAMYDAWHGIVPVSAVDAVAPVTPADVVGPVCESGDTFARDRMLPPLAAGARVAILDAGAYGSVMSSAYNARPVAAEVMVDGSDWSVIRERQSHADLWRGERDATLAEMNAAGRRVRSPAAPACRPPRAGPLRHPVRTHLAGAVAGARRCRRCSSASHCSICRACCRRGAHIGLLAVTASADRSGCWSAACATSRAPDDKAADRRLEVASGLSHRPLAVLTDRPSRGTARTRYGRRSRSGRRMSRARSARCAGCASALPRPGLARRDPRALRAALVVALVAAFAIAGDDAPSRLAQAMEPTLPRDAAAAGDRAAGLDHAARLHAAGADLPEAGQRHGVGAGRRRA